MQVLPDNDPHHLSSVMTNTAPRSRAGGMPDYLSTSGKAKYATKPSRNAQASANQSAAPVSSGIHHRLYQEKDKYFERKKKAEPNTKEEEELKQCTFHPNASSPKRESNPQGVVVDEAYNS